ncbi:Vacuolar protein sorting-associated protein 13D [Manis javanica]|nr:Vacuolar protein sorting-associated protein 13D [Manis javanica]
MSFTNTQVLCTWHLRSAVQIALGMAGGGGGVLMWLLNWLPVSKGGRDQEEPHGEARPPSHRRNDPREPASECSQHRGRDGAEKRRKMSSKWAKSLQNNHCLFQFHKPKIPETPCRN